MGPQYLCRLVDEASGNLGCLDTSLVKWGIGDDQVKTLLQYRPRAIARPYLYIRQTALFNALLGNCYRREASIHHGNMALACQPCDMQANKASSTPNV